MKVLDLNPSKEYINQRGKFIEFSASHHIYKLIKEVERLVVVEKKACKRIADLEAKVSEYAAGKDVNTDASL